MSPLTVAVHGATGSQGAPVVAELIARGHTVRAITRRPENAPAGTVGVAADLLDAEALTRAYEGADAVVLQLPLVFDASAEAMADAAARAVTATDVPRALLNLGGPVPPEPIGVPYLDARLRLLRALEGGPASALAIGPAGPYMENLSLPASIAALKDGELAYPLPAQAPVPWVATADLATLIADAIVGDEEGRLVVVGPELLTGDAAAATLADTLGHPVAWRALTPAEYETRLTPAIGAHAAAGIAGFYAAAADGAPPPPPPAPESVRVGPTTLAAWAETLKRRAAA